MEHANIVRPWKSDDSVPSVVKYWLLAGVIMVFLQIIIGGVTRLTGSGLSITRWEIVTGTVPPLTSEQWDDAFNLYKQTPQYSKVNKGISLSDFKFIYFWEYFHRLWARLMFFVFIIPFVFFYFKRWFSKKLIPRLLVVVLLAGLEGFFGWIMVASGLSKRPWVNAYNLTLHLTMGIIIFSYLLWTFFMAAKPRIVHKVSSHPILTFSWVYILLLFYQIALGALMSGTKAALFYPTWPDMNGALFPEVLLKPEHWTVGSFVQYDSNPFFPALIQFVHRSSAYVIAILTIVYIYRMVKMPELLKPMRNVLWLLMGVLITQVILGIFTLIHSIGVIPVFLGVLHQGVAIVLLSVALWIAYVLPANMSSAKLP
jgi:cytochrome c oxidase assembly protein subunit 15